MVMKIKTMSSQLYLPNEKRNGEWQHGKTKIVLFSGKAGTGKTTSANILKKLVEQDFLLVDIDSFANGVKLEASRKGWDGKKDVSGRKFLQDVGREGREKDNNIWVNQVIERSIQPIPKDVVIIDDWRYPNELQRLKNNKLFDVISVRINAPEREILTGTKEANDSSETALSSENNLSVYDFFIENSGTIKELEEELLSVMEVIIK